MLYTKDPCSVCDNRINCFDDMNLEYVIVTFTDNRYGHCKQKVFDNYDTFLSWYKRYVCKRIDIYESNVNVLFVRCRKEAERLNLYKEVFI